MDFIPVEKAVKDTATIFLNTMLGKKHVITA